MRQGAGCDRSFEPYQPNEHNHPFQEAGRFLEGSAPACSASGDTTAALTDAAADLAELLAVGGHYHG